MLLLLIKLPLWGAALAVGGLLLPFLIPLAFYAVWRERDKWPI